MIRLNQVHLFELQADVLEAVLDRCLFGSKLVVTDVLEADMDGCLPGDEAYTPNKGISLIQYLGSKPALVSVKFIA